MRPTTDLLLLDWVFSQQSPLTFSEFTRECERRGYKVQDWYELEALHRINALTPLFRFEKHIDEIHEQANRTGENWQSVIARHLNDMSSLSHYLHGHNDIGHLEDPRKESFQSWSNYILKHETGLLWRSTFLFSYYQLLLIPDLRRIKRYMQSQLTENPRYIFGRSLHFDLPPDPHKEVIEIATKNDEIILLLSALETRYLPMIQSHLTDSRGRGLEYWNEYSRSFDPITMLEWLNWSPEKVKEAAKQLLWIAHCADPLDDWIDLVRLIRPEKWQRLKGDALIAMDHRIAAEIILHFYEHLVQKGVAEPLEESSQHWRGPFDGRLKTDRKELDSVLMEYGISPQPSLILVLEGETEAILVPRVMELLGIPDQPDYIKLFTSAGVGRDLGILAKYAVTPQPGKLINGGFLLNRPPTHFFVVMDAEGGYASAEDREKKRKAFVEDIWRALPTSHRAQISLNEIDQIVEVETWNDNGDSFEFAHLTDQEIAQSSLNVYCPSGESKAPPLERLEEQVSLRRKHKANLEGLWERWGQGKPTKLLLAEALWIILEQKINQAIKTETQKAIPVARILIHAVEVAGPMSRNSVMIRKNES